MGRAIIETMAKHKNAPMDWPAKIGGPQQIAFALPTFPPAGVEFITTEEAHSIYLARIRVPLKLRGSGIASRLVDQLKDRARKAGKSILLQMNPDEGEEANVLRFYKKRGFTFLSDNSTMIWRP